MTGNDLTHLTPSALGERLRRIRLARGLGQGEMARSLDYPQSMVSKIEKGKRKVTVQELEHWCRICNVSADDLLSGAPITVQIGGEVAS